MARCLRIGDRHLPLTLVSVPRKFAQAPSVK
jgi:hypothetical protein